MHYQLALPQKGFDWFRVKKTTKQMLTGTSTFSMSRMNQRLRIVNLVLANLAFLLLVDTNLSVSFCFHRHNVLHFLNLLVYSFIHPYLSDLRTIAKSWQTYVGHHFLFLLVNQFVHQASSPHVITFVTRLLWKIWWLISHDFFRVWGQIRSN